jgi:hypothetical protein
VRRKPAAIDTRTNWLRVSRQQNKRRIIKMTQALTKKTTQKRMQQSRSRSKSTNLASSLMSRSTHRVDLPWNLKQPKEPEQEELLALRLQPAIPWPKTTIWCA